MGIFEGLDAEPYDRKYSDNVLLKRIFEYFIPQRKRLVVIVIVAILISLISASSVLIVSHAVDLIKSAPTVMNISPDRRVGPDRRSAHLGGQLGGSAHDRAGDCGGGHPACHGCVRSVHPT